MLFDSWMIRDYAEVWYYDGTLSGVFAVEKDSYGFEVVWFNADITCHRLYRLFRLAPGAYEAICDLQTSGRADSDPAFELFERWLGEGTIDIGYAIGKTFPEDVVAWLKASHALQQVATQIKAEPYDASPIDAFFRLALLSQD